MGVFFFTQKDELSVLQIWSQFFLKCLSSFHSKLCQWTWATAAFGAVETVGRVSMAALQPLTLAAQVPPHGPLLMFPSPPLGPVSQVWWTHSTPLWWLSPSRKHNPSPADITCTQLVSTTQYITSDFLNFWKCILNVCCCLWKQICNAIILTNARSQTLVLANRLMCSVLRNLICYSEFSSIWLVWSNAMRILGGDVMKI